jgi:DNA repair protein RecN (Recombination protein N)
MLLNLNIKDFILIDQLDLDFSKGLIVITGETGAGKSILLDSILFALGGKFNNDLIKKGADYCSVTLTFLADRSSISYLTEIGIEIAEEIVIKATQLSSGRKKFFINDQVVTQKVVNTLSGHFLELHGQHEQTTLTSPSVHLEILDEYANSKPILAELKDSYKIWQDLEKEIVLFQQEKDDLDKEIDYLTHVCAELELLDLKENEEEKLSDLRHKLQGRDKEINLIGGILSELDNSGFEQLISKAQRNIAKSMGGGELETADSFLEEAYDKIEQAKLSLQEYLSKFEQDEYSLEEIENRLYEIRNIARKHSCLPSELLKFQVEANSSLQTLRSRVTGSNELEKKAKIAKEEYYKTARELSLLRQQNAVKLQEKTMAELAELEMKKAVFEVSVISSEANSSSGGIDQVRFSASTNPGMPLLPIDQVASGGELSRFMLALRTALFDKGNKQTIIFDEIDVGISGSVTDSVGQHLKKLSKAVQVITITHQPQIAGKADQHVLVSKIQYQDHTKVEIKTLDHEAKSLELARMISGQKITKTGLEAARELLSQ